jgi:isopenicillin N synthase-like dioxygenase
MQHLRTDIRIPTIDLRHPDAAASARRFGEALEHFGFAIVVNHGVDPKLLARAYDVSRRAFSLPVATKRKYETPENGRDTGYASFGVEHAKDDPRADLKEFWHVRKLVEPERAMFPAEIADFGATCIELYDALDAEAARLLGCLDAYLGEQAGTFPGMVKGGNTLLRLLRYPEIVGSPDGMRAAAHEDINFITLLVAATAAGLEVKTRDGQWIAVDNPPDAIIVNSGDMLQAFTGGRIPSTTHRVVNGDGKERYSIPFFVHPRSEVMLTGELTAGEYLRQRLIEIGLIKA